MTKFKKAIKIKLDIYGISLNILYNYTPKEVVSFVNKSDFQEGMKEQMIKWHEKGEHSRCFSGNGANNLILLSEESSTYELINTLSHEVMHFVFEMADYINLKHCSESEEAFTYLNGYIMGECYRLLIEPIVKYNSLKD